MVIVSHRVPLPFLAPPLAPSGFSAIASNPIQAGETLYFLSATALLEDFSMMYPRSGKEPYTDGGRVTHRTERPDMRGGPDHDFSDTRD
jgi:hypothetical protein